MSSRLNHTAQCAIATLRIATELHGQDPLQFSVEEQKAAILRTAKYGPEEFTDTIIALLPIELRPVACTVWGLLNS